MAKTVRKKIRKRNVSKSRQVIELIKEWKEVVAIIISVGTLIYYVTSYKVEIENKIDDKINEQQARTLIQIENQTLKEDVRLIKEHILKGN